MHEGAVTSLCCVCRYFVIIESCRVSVWHFPVGVVQTPNAATFVSVFRKENATAQLGGVI
jgi:hypothetical protein